MWTAEERYVVPSGVSATMAKTAKMMATALLAYVQILSVRRVRMEYKMELRPVSTVEGNTARVAQTEDGVRSVATVHQAVASLSLRCEDQGSAPQDFRLGQQPR
eukprot:COSAG02_NODE_15161_length_1198_cov_1.061874_1_plen_104_part_10